MGGQGLGSRASGKGHYVLERAATWPHPPPCLHPILPPFKVLLAPPPWFTPAPSRLCPLCLFPLPLLHVLSSLTLFWVPLPLGNLLSFSRPQVCVSTWPLSSVASYFLSPLHPHPTKCAWILLYKAGPFIHRGLTPTQCCLCPGGSEPNGDRGMSVPLRQALSTFVGLSLFWCVAESCLHSPIPRMRAHTYTLTHIHSSLTNSNPNSQSRESKRLSLHHP